MAIQVLCPACGAVATFHVAPVTECPHCHTMLPPASRRAAERVLRLSQVPKPGLLILGQWASAFGGALFLLLLVLAPFDLATYSINGEPVSGPEFLRRGGWSFGLIGICLLAISVGLWRQREWARPLIVSFWVLMGMLTVGFERDVVSDLVWGLISVALCTGLAVWYLYGKPNVVAYFRAHATDGS